MHPSVSGQLSKDNAMHEYLIVEEITDPQESKANVNSSLLFNILLSHPHSTKPCIYLPG